MANPAIPGDALTDLHREFLAEHTQVYLVVRRPDGTPMAYPMVGRWADGAMEFSTYRKSAKIRAVERDDRVCCLVVPRDRSADDRILAAWGHAAMGDTGRQRWQAALNEGDGSAGIEVPAAIRAKVADRLGDTKRGILRVDVERATFVGGDRG